MDRFNPFKCKSEYTRRLSVNSLIITLLAWAAWIGFASNGFSQMHPLGWTVLFGAPIAAYLVLLAVVPILRNASRDVRYLVSISLMWIFMVAAWGYIADWENDLSYEQYIALFVLPPIGVLLGFVLWKWSKAS